MVRHTAVAFATTTASPDALDFADADAVDRGSRSPAPTALAVEERLPPGAAAALLNRAHTDTDLVLFVDRRPVATCSARIDGVADDRPSSAPTRAAFVERLWRHDLVVIDATRGGIDR